MIKEEIYDEAFEGAPKSCASYLAGRSVLVSIEASRAGTGYRHPARRADLAG